ncbi:MAG: response regulator transcription factor [Bernardetiaceae bacterium]|nr:response regulator transcription factor [Bernardetiaceae bacterium]
MTRILLIEDEPRLASLIQRRLEEETDLEVTLAYDGEMGLKLALSQNFELIITDLILPKINGIALCKNLREKFIQIPILMLTALGTTDDKVEGFDAGADDYLVKPFEFRELLARIRALLKRLPKVSEPHSILRYHDIEMDTQSKTVKRADTDIVLTPKEFNLLGLFLQNPERVLSREEIANKVWQTHYDTGTNFIDVYINYLRKKIDKPFDKKLIHTKTGMGFVLKVKG